MWQTQNFPPNQIPHKRHNPASFPGASLCHTPAGRRRSPAKPAKPPDAGSPSPRRALKIFPMPLQVQISENTASPMREMNNSATLYMTQIHQDRYSSSETRSKCGINTKGASKKTPFLFVKDETAMLCFCRTNRLRCLQPVGVRHALETRNDRPCAFPVHEARDSGRA